MTTEAVHTSCEALSSSSVDSITAVNDYVEGLQRERAPMLAAKAGPAIDSLNHSADLVASSVSDPLSPELRDALNAWVDAARGVANAIAGNYAPDDFNAAVTKSERRQDDGAEPLRRGISMNLSSAGRRQVRVSCDDRTDQTSS